MYHSGLTVGNRVTQDLPVEVPSWPMTRPGRVVRSLVCLTLMYLRREWPDRIIPAHREHLVRVVHVRRNTHLTWSEASLSRFTRFAHRRYPVVVVSHHDGGTVSSDILCLVARACVDYYFV